MFELFCLCVQLCGGGEILSPTVGSVHEGDSVHTCICCLDRFNSQPVPFSHVNE